MITSKIKHALLFIILPIFISCDNSVDPNVYDNASLTFIQSGGIMGMHDELNIHNTRIATYQSKIFSSTLLYQLTEEEFSEIQSYYKTFDNYNDSYDSECIDDFHYQLTIENSEKEKTIEFGSCSINKYSELEDLAALISKLNSLRTKIYEEKETWSGLTYEFYTDKTVYSRGEQIVFSCKVQNPTDIVKKLDFKNEHKIQFAIHNEFKPRIQFRMPSTSVVNTDSLGGMVIPLEPNEEITFNFTWDQKFTNYNKDLYGSLPAGEYTSTIYLKGVNYPRSEYINFTVE